MLTRSNTGWNEFEEMFGASCDFRRRFSIPSGIDASKISAELKDGVMRLHLPKSEALKPRQIAVRAG